MSWKRPDGTTVSTAGNVSVNDQILISRGSDNAVNQATLQSIGDQLGFITSASVAEFVASATLYSTFQTKSSCSEFLTSASVSSFIGSFGFLTDGITSASADARYLVSSITTAQTCALVEAYGYLTSALVGDYITSQELSAKGYLTSAVTTAQVSSIVETYGFLTSALTTAQADALYITSAEVEAYGYLTSTDISDYITSQELSAKNYITSAITTAQVSSLVENYGYLTSAITTAQVCNIASAMISAFDINVEQDTNPRLGGYLDLRHKGYTTSARIATSVAFSKMQIGRINTSGTFSLANAAAESLGKGDLMLCLSATTTGDASATFLAEGFVSTSNLTAGTVYYLDTSAGGITATKPTALNSIVRRIGQARTSASFYFRPSDTYSIVSAGGSPANVPDAITDLQATQADQEIVLTFTEPNDNNSTLISYIAQYQDAASATASAWICVTALTSIPAVTVSGLENATEYTFRVYSKNGIGNSTLSNVVSASPTITTDLTSIITSGLVAWWDSLTFTTATPKWANQVVSPADGSSASAYDLSTIDVSTYSQNRFVMNNTSFFPVSNSANTAFTNSMHHTDSTTPTKWTWFYKGKTGDGDAVSATAMDSLFGTADVCGTDFGMIIRSDTGGALKYDQYIGSNKTTICAPGLVIEPNTLYNIAIAVNTSANKIYFSNMKSGVTTASAWTTVDAPFTANISASATYSFCIGAEGNGAGVMNVSSEMYTQILINRAITASEVNRLMQWADTYYFPPAATTAGQVTNLQATPIASGAAFLTWSLTSTGGAAITNYPIEYKVDSTTVWTSANNTTTVQYATVCGLNAGTNYDFRARAQNAAGIGPYSTTASCVPTTAGNVSAPYAIGNYKLTLPVTSVGWTFTNNAHEILQPELATYESQYFVRGDGTFKFVCPPYGATTDTATYPRVEFRELDDIAYTVCTQDELIFAVSAITDGKKTVVHQIHGTGSPPYFKTVYTGKDDGTGVLRALCKVSANSSVDDYTIFLKTGISNGDKIKLKTIYTGTALLFYVDDVLVSTQPMQMTGGTYYWKRGNYYQVQTVSADVSHCAVVHYTNGNNYQGA